MTIKLDRFVHNISRLVPVEGDDIERGAVGIADGKIAWLGPASELEKVCDTSGATAIDARGGLVTPGLVDCHTHFVFGGARQHEFVMRIQGKSYQEIAAAGGGIRSSMLSTRGSTDEKLYKAGEKALNDYLAQGVTTIEGKSGYGLSTKDELRVLKVMQQLSHGPDN